MTYIAVAHLVEALVLPSKHLLGLHLSVQQVHESFVQLACFNVRNVQQQDC
jgi:hypothetical protein